MEKINYLDYQVSSHPGLNNNNYNNNQHHQTGVGMGGVANQMFEQKQQQQCQSISDTEEKHSIDLYQYYANSQESFNNKSNTQQQITLSPSITQANMATSSLSNNTYNHNYETFSTQKPFFHSPQINNVSKCQLSQMKLTYSPNQNTIHLQPISQSSQPKHSFNFSQIESIQSFPQLLLQQNNSSYSAESNYTPCTTSFDTDSLYTSQELSIKRNRTQRRSIQATSYSNYFQRPPFLNSYVKNAPTNNHKQNQQYNTFPNNYTSPPIQMMKNKHRKQSFNSSTSTCDDSTDYQFRARSGSYQSTLNNQFNNPNKKKQIEERCSRKLKRTIKHYTKQNTFQFGTNQSDYNQQSLFNDVGLEELHESENHRITNEDLITTHQEQMKEEQNYKQNNNNENYNNNICNNDKDEDELNISEKEEEIDNLDEITLESVHKQNYGCSMIDKILDEWSNEEELKADKGVSSQIHSNQIVSQNELEIQSSTNLETKTDFDKELPSKNTQFEKSYFSKSITIQEDNNIKQNSDCWQQESQLKNNILAFTNEGENGIFLQQQQQEEGSKINQDSFEKIMSQESVSQQKIICEDQSNCSSIKMQNEDLIESETNLNILLEQANKHIENPLALYEIVQKLAQQIREKEQTIRNMEIENNIPSIKSLTSINSKLDESDNKFISSGLKKLTLEETK